MEESKVLFEFISAEKEKYYKSVTSRKTTYFIMGSLFIIGSFFPKLIDTSVWVATLVSLFFIGLIGVTLLSLGNESIMSNEARRSFYNAYKIQLAGNLLKLISQELQYKPQSRIVNQVIAQSGLFGGSISEYKGKNLIIGQFENSEIQMAEMLLWKGLRRQFDGLFVYVSNVDERKIDSKAIEQLKGIWNVKNNNLYMAFSGIKNLFEVRVERSDRSIDNFKYQLNFLINVLQIASNAADISIHSEYKVPDLHPTSEELLKPYKTYYNPATKESYKLAPSSIRFYNLFIDRLITTVIWLLGVFIYSPAVKPLADSEAFLISSYFIILFLYYVIAESSYSQTIGKYITGTKVITTKGEGPGLTSIIKRSFCRFIPFEAFSFVNSEIGLHDRCSGTIVIINESPK